MNTCSPGGVHVLLRVLPVKGHPLPFFPTSHGETRASSNEPRARVALVNRVTIMNLPMCQPCLTHPRASQVFSPEARGICRGSWGGLRHSSRPHARKQGRHWGLLVHDLHGREVLRKRAGGQCCIGILFHFTPGSMLSRESA